jgi:hypothetical protein
MNPGGPPTPDKPGIYMLRGSAMRFGVAYVCIGQVTGVLNEIHDEGT